MYEIALVWPELLSGQEDSSVLVDQPSVGYEAWWAWLLSTELFEELQRGGCGALFVHTTEGLTYEQIEWTSPAALLEALERLRALVSGDGPFAERALSEYESFAKLEVRSGASLTNFLADLDVIAAMARWTAARGKNKVTFQINF